MHPSLPELCTLHSLLDRVHTPTPMAQGRSTKFISMIKWIRTRRLSIKNSLHVEGPAFERRRAYFKRLQDRCLEANAKIDCLILSLRGRVHARSGRHRAALRVPAHVPHQEDRLPHHHTPGSPFAPYPKDRSPNPLHAASGKERTGGEEGIKKMRWTGREETTEGECGRKRGWGERI